jgi:hypothetical protein
MINIARGIFATIAMGLWLVSCASPARLTPPAAPTALDLIGQAEAEATAILQQARATALVLQAQTQATQLIGQAGEAPATAVAPAATEGRVLAVQATPNDLEAPPAATPTANNPEAMPGGMENTVELLGVGFAAEGSFIIVNFKAPPSVVQDWWQGQVSVTDEASGTVYNEIPVLPVIGPLIGRPVEAGQIGYVMLTHNPPNLRIGSLVTVALGEYKFEHVKIE